MNKKLRDFMFFFFVLLFCITTALLSLYAAGYRLDLARALKGRVLQKTGMLILDSTPKGAAIYLDGKQVKSSGSIFGDYAITPAKVKNLLPKEYLVEVKLEGYWPWEKKLTVYGGQSTYAENIILFKRCIPTEAQESLVESCAINLDGSVKDQKIVSSIVEKIGKTDKLKTEDNSLFFFSSEGRINSYNQRNSETTIILDSKNKQEEYLDFLPENGKLFVVAKKGARVELRSYEQKGGEATKKINLPGAWKYELSSDQKNFITAYNPDSKNLFIFEENNLNPYGNSLSGIDYWNWIEDNKLLVAGNFEIAIYDLKNNNRWLITRISEKITGLAWSKKKNYLIYTTEKSINSIDLYEGSGLITKLLDGKNISQPTLDDKNKTLYFQAETNGTIGWQKIEVQ